MRRLVELVGNMITGRVNDDDDANIKRTTNAFDRRSIGYMYVWIPRVRAR